jgi:hypothetical protein
MLFSGLEEIPWQRLKHAYGTAGDVPGQLRALQTESASAVGDDSALRQLCGNIWHQGTVYEATSFAVPFLLELAADPTVPRRNGVVDLLAAIAGGNSYLDVHEDVLVELRVGDPDSQEHRRKKAIELEWVANAKSEVAKGIDLFLELTKEKSEVRLTAAEALSRLNEFDDRAGKRLLELLAEAKDPIDVACYLVLVARARVADEELGTFLSRLRSEAIVVRRAATSGCLLLRHNLDSSLLRSQIVETILDEQFDERVEELPIDAGAFWELRAACLREMTSDEKANAAETLCGLLEAMTINNDQAEILLELTFEKVQRNGTRVENHQLSDVQRRVLAGLLKAIREEKVSIQLPQKWGLPALRRGLKNLIDGKPPVDVDERLPMLGTERDPMVPLKLKLLKNGDRVHHRKYGFGSVESVKVERVEYRMVVNFDEEGRHTLFFTQSMLCPDSLLIRIMTSIWRRLSSLRS